jgi:hypothetical protein
MAIEWVTKNEYAVGVSSDIIRIKFSTNHSGKETAYITFGEKALAHIEGKQILFGVDGEKLYFCGTDDGEGYRLSRRAHAASLFVIGSTSSIFRSFAGKHEVQIDPANGLPFIDKSRNISWVTK